jgi:Pyridoxamine 5'-phosphate oxidase
MGQIYETITPALDRWIKNQQLFFVATAPLSKTGHVNCSPKGLDSLRILNPTSVAYLDLTGSGAETLAHLRENGRIVFMFCALNGPPKIVRLHGTGRVVTKNSTEWSELAALFPSFSAPRSIVVTEVARVSDSCGFGVPKYEFQENRDALECWAATKGQAALPEYRKLKNAQSVDGLRALDPGDA